MAEWFKAHAWKACVGNTTVSSNLTLSATFLLIVVKRPGIKPVNAGTCASCLPDAPRRFLKASSGAKS